MRVRHLCICLLFALTPSYASAAESEATKLLTERSEQLKPTITRVSIPSTAPSGYSPANISMIVGKSGIVIVDTGMFPQDAQTVLAEFRKITDLPVAAIILTHGHGDHTGGTAAFVAAGGDPKPPIYARAPFDVEGAAFKSAGLTINRLRSARQGGFLLPPEKRINNGIAPVGLSAKGQERLRRRRGQAHRHVRRRAQEDRRGGRHFGTRRRPRRDGGGALRLVSRRARGLHRRQLLPLVAEPVSHSRRGIPGRAGVGQEPRPHDCREAGPRRPGPHAAVDRREGDERGSGELSQRHRLRLHRNDQGHERRFDAR